MTEPILTHLLAKAWANKPAKPTALGTPLRYSSALGCKRQMGYNALEATPSNPMDEGDAWAPGIGTALHELAQAEIGKEFETARFEVASGLTKYISGSCDCLLESQEILRKTNVNVGGTHALWEFKTMGEYAFDKQVGFNRRARKVGHGEGPKVEAITQSGLNALGLEDGDPSIRIETLILGSVCIASLSVAMAAQMGVSGFDRIGAEFLIERSAWEPLARAERDRMMGVGFLLDDGYLDDRIAGPVESPIYLNPRGTDWQCTHCSFRDTCVQDGEGVVPIEMSWTEIRSK